MVTRQADSCWAPRPDGGDGRFIQQLSEVPQHSNCAGPQMWGARKSQTAGFIACLRSCRSYENMVVKTRKSNAKDQSSEKDRSQSASGKIKRAKDGKGSASQSKNGLFAGFIRSKLGLSPSAFARGISVLVIGKALFLSR